MHDGNVTVSDDRSNLPAPGPTLDRAALERVLARAAELQANAADPLDQISEQRLLELGQEVGLGPQHLRQALAEERTRIVMPVEQGLAARLFGPAGASATRTVRGQPPEILALLDRWMQKDECLQVKRRFPDRIIWEARRDLVGSIKRGLKIGGRGYALSRAREVSATVFRIDDAQTIVRLDADLGNVRAARVQGGAAVAGGGLVAGSILVVLHVMVPVALLPTLAAAGAGYVLARTQGEAAARAQLGLEQLLDRLELGEPRGPVRALDIISEAARMIR